MNNTWVWIVIIIIVGLGIWWWLGSSPANDNLPTGDGATEEVDDNLETATLSAVGDYSGSGVATRKFVDGTFTHTVLATLLDPAEDKFYEGWLVVPDSMNFFSTGKLDKDGDEWKLIYASDQDELIHSLVVVTEETLINGLDGQPEAHVLKGRF